MLRTLPQEANTGKHHQQQHHQNEKPNDKIVILADLSLLEFPLEALKLFHKNQTISSISRDFSMQFLYNRCFPEKEACMKINNKICIYKKLKKKLF